MKRIFSIILPLLLIAANALAQPEIRSQWQGKRVAFLGDSIIDVRQVQQTNNTFCNDLKDILGIESYVYGISGHRMNQIIGQGERLEQEHGQNVDAIIVFIGTNDYNGNIPVGEWYTYSMEQTIDDGPIEVTRKHRELVYDDSTFKGRANTTLRWLKTHYPDKQIIFLTPLHRGFARFSDNNIQPPESFANAAGFFIDDYVQAVKELANVWAVPVIDLNSVSGLYPVLDEYTRYFRRADTDRLHPNTPGHIRMAYAIAYQLMGYPASFPKYIALNIVSAGDKKADRTAMISAWTSGVKATVNDSKYASFGEPAGDWTDICDGDIIKVEATSENLSAMKAAIPELKEAGFTFVTVPELFKIRGADPVAGVTYYNAY